MENCLTLFIEGNLGVGKTTLLDYFRNTQNVVIVQEPLTLWENCVGVNLLKKMYENPEKWLFKFQVYAMQTLTNALFDVSVKPGQVILCERSIFSGK
jgi:deoxyadenosine/deoxycytidine kinase